MDWSVIQARLDVARDGRPGPITYAALLRRLAGASVPLAPAIAAGLAVHVPAYHVDRPARLPAFVAQVAHESGRFRFLRELGGATYLARYDGRADLGNTEAGDGARYCGRGLIQLTGRKNYRIYGTALGLPLLEQPELASDPAIAARLALEYWQRNDLNDLADEGRFGLITRRINGGTNGAADRLLLWQRAKLILL
jgi:putative chitinase